MPEPQVDHQPLAGLKVLELAQLVAAPGGALVLADYGAEVIKVEPLEGDTSRLLKTAVAKHLDAGPVFAAYNRNKRVIKRDLKNPAHKAEVWTLMADADVVIVSSRPGAIDRLGFGAADVLEAYPKMIYATVSGFRWTEPRPRRGVDLVIQAESGIMSTTGPAGGEPTKFGFTAVDAACCHVLAHAVLAALVRRNRTGMGAVVRVNLYDVALHLQSAPMTEYRMAGQQTPRTGNVAALTAPAGLFNCGEGQIVLSAYAPTHWRNLCEALSSAAWLSDPRFLTPADRVHNRDDLTALMEDQLARKSAAAWVEILDAAGVMVGEVKDYEKVVADIHTSGSDIFGGTGDVYGVRVPVVIEGVEPIAFTEPDEVARAEWAI